MYASLQGVAHFQRLGNWPWCTILGFYVERSVVIVTDLYDRLPSLGSVAHLQGVAPWPGRSHGESSGGSASMVSRKGAALFSKLTRSSIVADFQVG